MIGPKMYPYFMLILKIVLTVLTVLMFINLGISIFEGVNSAADFGTVLAQNMQEYLSSILSAFGSIVLVFVILERFMPDARILSMDDENKKKDWDPLSLMKEPDRDEVKTWDPILAIFFALACLVVFNFFPQIIAVTVRLNPSSTPVVASVLSDAFYTYLPWLSLVWCLDIILNTILLRMGHWSIITRSLAICIKAGGLGIAVAMVLGPSLVALNIPSFAPITLNSSAVSLSALLDPFVRLALVIAIITSAVDIAKGLYKLITRYLLNQPLPAR